MWNKLKHQIWHWRGVLVAAPTVAGLVLALRMTGLLQTFEWIALDLFFRWRPREPVSESIIIIGINEADIQHVGRWPMPDRVLTKLLENVKKQQPRAIGLDLYRDLPVEPGYDRLVKVFKTTPNLIGIQKVIGDVRSSAVAPPPVLEQQGQVGANDVILDADGRIRRALLYLRDGDEIVEGFGWRLALIYLEAKGITPESSALNPQYLQLGQALFTPFEPNDGSYVGADAGGYQILLNFHGPARSFPSIPMTEVLENRIPPNLLRDRIVLIGTASDSSLRDIFYTPYSSRLASSPEFMAGVEVQANLVSQVLNSALKGRSQIKTWSDSVETLWIIGWALVGTLLTWTQRNNYVLGVRSLWVTMNMLLAAGVLVSGSYLAFLGGWWIPVFGPILALTGSALTITAYVARTAGKIRKTFGRYLTDEVVTNLLETPDGLKLGGQRRKVTIMLTDLRGFSAISERFPPETVVTFLNIYLGIMADIITQYKGTIDEFIGDAILVIFGAPTQREDDAERAIACAVAMQLAMNRVNEQIKHLDVPKIEMGIAINTGEVVVGNIGSDKRAKYGIVGSHVNLTGRIESYTVGGQILLSEYTLKDIKNICRIDEQIKIEAKGIKEPIAIYDIGGIGGKYNLYLPQKEEDILTLPEPIPLEYTVLDGKYVVGTKFLGSLVKLSDKGGEIYSENPVVLLSNIKINLLKKTDTDESLGDFYAKVTGKPAHSDCSFRIRFTAVPPGVTALIDALLANKRS